MTSMVPAARVVERLWRDIDRAYNPAYAIEAQVDGGEWSGPALQSGHENAYEDAVHLVAVRYGHSHEALWQFCFTREMDLTSFRR